MESPNKLNRKWKLAGNARKSWVRCVRYVWAMDTIVRRGLVVQRVCKAALEEQQVEATQWDQIEERPLLTTQEDSSDVDA